VRLAAVCDIDPRRLAEVAADFDVRGFADYEELVHLPGVDWIAVCTPEDRHIEPTLAALDAGRPVLIEKPVAHTLEGARRIAAAARRTGRLVMVGHLLRFEPRWVAASERIAAGAIGDIVSIATRRVGNVMDQEVLRGRTSAALYYGVHDLDVLRWFAGSEVATLYAARRYGVLRRAGYDVADLYCAVLTFANGVLASAELGWHAPAGVRARTSGLMVVGTRGVLRIDQGQQGLDVWPDDGGPVDTTFWPEAYGRTQGALALELRHFVDCVRRERTPALSLDDAIEALRLALAVEESAARGSTIDLLEYARA
jgi:UDP-N-acetylglucosamine 3-dehydrogenase